MINPTIQIAVRNMTFTDEAAAAEFARQAEKTLTNLYRNFAGNDHIGFADNPYASVEARAAEAPAVTAQDEQDLDAYLDQLNAREGGDDTLRVTNPCGEGAFSRAFRDQQDLERHLDYCRKMG